MANRNVKVDYEMVQEAPPVKVITSHKPILANVATIRKEATGKWYRIARFDSTSGGYNRAGSLRRRDDMKLLEFKGSLIDEVEQPEDYAAGWRSQLHCRWIGAKGKPGTKAGEEGGLAVIGDDGEPKKRRGRPPGSRNAVAE